ncbi:2-(3-amino-3-carboxypropyl)histidine synthase subunit 2 [Diaphorina citri]|uniref:2-(3-amino-3-carboxypropyl)histidine synthase subunit 2 n=1 Tax=Diaphorina citri TaxID=121845 RepID=A0A3Q0IZ26_DIACI|nr:2-(3-amino-3-carboxypropyl)histidine synthase subunit 2 [Diaphorina citri]
MANVTDFPIAMALLYSDEKSVLDRQINVENHPKLSKDELVDVFELERCLGWITEHQLSRICLQFPDELLEYSVVIAQHLEQKSFKQIFILGDTSYGSCCVDEVAASHVNADGIIHFGHSCLSTVNRLPVLYVFTKQQLDTEKFLNSISELGSQSQLVVLYDTCYAHCFDEAMCQNLAQLTVTISRLSTSTSATCGVYCRHPEDHQVSKLGRQYCLSEDRDKSVIYVYVCDSKPCRNLDNFVMSMPESSFYQFNPDSNLLSPVPQSAVVKKHLYLSEKVKDAQNVGILVATLVVNKYLTAVNHVKALCKKHGKRSYIISVGKPNVPKLANFPEIDVYVLISCPEMCLPNAKEFLQPVVHLIDVELALNPARSWENKVNLDFTQLISGGAEFVSCPDLVSPSMDISLLSNNVRVNGVAPDDTSELGLPIQLHGST